MNLNTNYIKTKEKKTNKIDITKEILMKMLAVVGYTVRFTQTHTVQLKRTNTVRPYGATIHD